MATKDYYAQFYETEDVSPHTCAVVAVVCHGVIYTYRKSWIRKRIKKKIVFQDSESCSRFWVKESLELARNKVKRRIEEVLNFLNEPEHIK